MPKKYWRPELLLILGALFIGIGSFITSDTAFWKKVFIVGGALIVFVGFYWKATDHTAEQLAKNLSGFGHSMVGIAAIFALVQIPEVLDQITQIKDQNMQIRKEIRAIHDKSKADEAEKFAALPPEKQKPYIDQLDSDKNKPLPGNVYLPPQDAKELKQALDQKGMSALDQKDIQSKLQAKLKIWG